MQDNKLQDLTATSLFPPGGLAMGHSSVPACTIIQHVCFKRSVCEGGPRLIFIPGASGLVLLIACKSWMCYSAKVRTTQTVQWLKEAALHKASPCCLCLLPVPALRLGRGYPTPPSVCSSCCDQRACHFRWHSHPSAHTAGYVLRGGGKGDAPAHETMQQRTRCRAAQRRLAFQRRNRALDR